MKQNSILFSLFFIVVSFTFIACNNSDKKESSKTPEASLTSFDLVKAKKSIEDANTEHMNLIKNSDSIGFANHYTSDAKIMAPGSPTISGRDNFRGFLHGFAKMGLNDFRLKTVDVWGSNDLLGEEGNWSLYDAKGTELDHGKYVVLWKQEDGKWKLFRDCWNSDAPCPTPGK